MQMSIEMTVIDVLLMILGTMWVGIAIKIFQLLSEK